VLNPKSPAFSLNAGNKRQLDNVFEATGKEILSKIHTSNRRQLDSHIIHIFSKAFDMIIYHITNKSMDLKELHEF